MALRDFNAALILEEYMKKPLLCLTLLLTLLAPFPVCSQSVLYTGNTRIDLDLGRFNDPGIAKIEVYRQPQIGSKVKIGDAINGGSGIVFYADKGLTKGQQYYYEAKVTKIDNSVEYNPIAIKRTGEVSGILVGEDETWTEETSIIDSVIVFSAKLTIAPGGNVIAAHRQFQTKINVKEFGTLTATGGSIKQVNIDCFGTFTPIKDFTFLGADVRIHNDNPVFMLNCILEEVPKSNDPVFFKPNGFSIEAHQCIVRGASELNGVALAESCIVEPYSFIYGTTMRNLKVKESGSIILQPNDVPTLCEYSRFDSCQALQLAQMSTVRHNTFTGLSTIQITAATSGFPPKEVGDIHINYNTFSRIGGDVGLISNIDADTIDARMNYWGAPTGPDQEQRNYKLWLDPYLRVPYPNPSYWLEIQPDKMSIVANDVDRVTFTGRLFEVLSGNPVSDSIVSYSAYTQGDTVVKGTAKSGPNGEVEFFIKLPAKYSSASVVLVRVSSMQGIFFSYWLNVGIATGPDLSVDDFQIIQVQADASGIIAEKPFAVKANISSTEAVPKHFQIGLKINGTIYTTFSRFAKSNIDDTFALKVLEDSLTISNPNGEALTVMFFPNVTTLPPGNHTIEVTIDPPELSGQYGNILESNEQNNTLTKQITAKKSYWGNEKNEPNFSVLFQPFEYPSSLLLRLNMWADSAIELIKKTFPMKSNQMSATKATDVLTTSQYLTTEPLADSTFENYIMKAYRLLRKQKPNYDRYVFSVPGDWFFTRVDPFDFDKTLCTSFSWSGIPDLVVARVHHFRSPVHELGHSFGLRRSDQGNDEEYVLYNVGKQVIDGVDFSRRGLKQYSIQDSTGHSQDVYCFMSGSYINFGREYWICDEDYSQLYAGFSSAMKAKDQWAKTAAQDAMIVTGRVDTAKTMEFGVWDKISNATISPSADSVGAKYMFKMLDASNNVLARYYYNPTFTSVSLDEGITPNPIVRWEYFAFVVPFPAATKQVSVEHQGQEITSRTVTANAPTAQIVFPPKDKVIADDASFLWQGNDADGGTLFYTLSISKDDGNTWQMLLMDVTETDYAFKITKFPNGNTYKIKVDVSDGILSSTVISDRFSIDNTVGVDPLAAASSVKLYPTFPNPFSNASLVQYEVSQAQHLTIEVTDVLGRVIETLVDENVDAGMHRLRLSSPLLRSGVYVLRLRTPHQTEMQKIIVSK